MALPVCLMVAEKPAICNAIASGLSQGSHESRGRTPPVHEFEGSFRGERVLFRVTSVTGHLYSLDFPRAYQNWEATDPKDLFSAETQKKCESKGVQALLQREAKNTSYLVLWLDCDREGENICFEVMGVTVPQMRKLNTQQVFRAKFSAVTAKDIVHALQHLGNPNKDESDAVDARQELDLKVGVALSRHFTLYFHGKYGDLDSSLVSYGPCLTPTLGFCVSRHDDIQSFKPEPFWTIVASVAAPSSSTSRLPVDVEWSRGRIFDKEIAEMFLFRVQEGRAFTVTRVKEGRSKKVRPQPLNTVEMLKVASKALAMGPHHAMRTAEELYLRGFISYPRTESTQYPESFDIKEAIRQQANDNGGVIGAYAVRLIREGFQRPRSGVDMGDHPPITPVQGGIHQLDGDAARLYNLVARFFLASVSPDAVFEKKSVDLSAGGEAFTANGSKLVVPGWMEIQLDLEAEVEKALPDYQEGEVVNLASIRLREGLTSPPTYLTESELIGLMERNGIGTDASISTHINNIQVRNYVQLGAGRTLVPTELGTVFIHGLREIDEELVAPRVRAAIENNCTLVAKGQASKDLVLAHALENFVSKFTFLLDHMDRMDALFECTFSPLAQTGKLLNKCGTCGRLMRLVNTGKVRLHCGTCDRTYAVPQQGTIKLLSGQYCPLDGFELVLFSLGNSAKAIGKMYPVCPRCYNDQREEPTSCIQCTNTECSHSAAALGICECPTGCGGTLTLNEYSAAKLKRISCNTEGCHMLIRIHVEPRDVTILSRECECGARKLKVEFGDTNPMPNGEPEYVGCMICDDLMNSFTEVVEGRSKNQQLIRHERAKRRERMSRGRGRGGKRRGGGARRPKDPRLTFDGF